MRLLSLVIVVMLLSASYLVLAPNRRSPESTAALDDAILADDWLMYCACTAEQWCSSFDSWWRLAEFDVSVRSRFVTNRPNDAAPSKGEIGKRVRILRKQHPVDAVGHRLVRRGEPVPDDAFGQIELKGDVVATDKIESFFRQPPAGGEGE